MYVGDAPVPSIKSDEILLRVRATAINRADTLQRKGQYPPPAGASSIMGLEAAGDVVAVGKDAKQFAPQQRVMALLAGGGYAEYAAVPAAHCMPIPNGFTYEQAAAIPETWLTAFQLLHFIANVKAGEYVMVHAGASGVGTSAIQLCNLSSAPYRLCRFSRQAFVLYETRCRSRCELQDKQLCGGCEHMVE